MDAYHLQAVMEECPGVRLTMLPSRFTAVTPEHPKPQVRTSFTSTAVSPVCVWRTLLSTMFAHTYTVTKESGRLGGEELEVMIGEMMGSRRAGKGEDARREGTGDGRGGPRSTLPRACSPTAHVTVSHHASPLVSLSARATGHALHHAHMQLTCPFSSSSECVWGPPGPSVR